MMAMSRISDNWQEEDVVKSRRHSRHGWTLTETRERSPSVTSITCARYVLDGLACSPQQAQDLMNGRPLGAASVMSTRVSTRDGYLWLNGVELTASEAKRINGGEDPVAVLMPTLVIRNLTLAELLAP